MRKKEIWRAGKKGLEEKRGFGGEKGLFWKDKKTFWEGKKPIFGGEIHFPVKNPKL